MIIKIKRGLFADLPILQNAELGYCTDTEQLFIGWGGSNVELTYDGTLPDGDYGDLSASGGVLTLDNAVVTLAKLADVATSTVFYRKTAGTGSPEVQTLATLKTDLGLTGSNTGDQTITLTGNVTGSGTGSFAATIANDAVTTTRILNNNVTNGKLAQMATLTLKGNDTGSTADPQDLTVSEVQTMLGIGSGLTLTQVYANIYTGI